MSNLRTLLWHRLCFIVIVTMHALALFRPFSRAGRTVFGGMYLLITMRQTNRVYHQYMHTRLCRTYKLKTFT